MNTNWHINGSSQSVTAHARQNCWNSSMAIWLVLCQWNLSVVANMDLYWWMTTRMLAGCSLWEPSPTCLLNLRCGLQRWKMGWRAQLRLSCLTMWGSLYWEGWRSIVSRRASVSTPMTSDSCHLSLFDAWHLSHVAFRQLSPVTCPLFCIGQTLSGCAPNMYIKAPVSTSKSITNYYYPLHSYIYSRYFYKNALIQTLVNID